MKVKVKRVETDLDMPGYQTSGSVGFDIYSREGGIIKPGEVKRFMVNLIIGTPKGYALFIIARSSLALKKGLKLINGVGVIDQDYCGDEDEFGLILHNFTKKPVKVVRGERMAQGVFVKIGIADFVEVKKMKKKSRGGIGSTGGYKK